MYSTKLALTMATGTIAGMFSFVGETSGGGVNFVRNPAPVAPFRWRRPTSNLDVANLRFRSEDVIVPEAILLSRLESLSLVRPLTVVIEPDDGAFLATALYLPQVYGYGDTKAEAIRMLSSEIESLWEDLQSGENEDFTPDWDLVREFLRSVIEK